MTTAPEEAGGGLAMTVLGCDGSYPGPGGACSGYLVTCQGTRVWLDAGSGTLANLQRHVAVEDVDAVVLSHQHPDHWTDLESFYVACRWYASRTGVPVYAPSGVRELMIGGRGDDTLRWHDIVGGDEVAIGPLRLRFSQTDHPVTTLAVRIDGAGRSLGYSADSGPGWALSSLGPDLDLALCEASFLSDKEGTLQHLSARQAGATAKAAGARRLVITHLVPGVGRDAARAEAEGSFRAPVEVATLGRRYVV